MSLVHNVYQHILSIGYEFETSSLIKLNYQPNGTFVNSDTTNMNLNEDHVTKLNDHYYKIMEPKIEYIEYVSESDMDGDTVNDQIVMKTLTDIADPIFQVNQLKPLCDTSMNKNNLYTFKTPSNQYPIHFSEHLTNSPCYTLSITEWIVTYYSPKLSNTIIADTFINAISRIYHLLQSLKEVKGNLYTQSTKMLGKMYHYPNTNLFFLNTNTYKNKTAPLLEESFNPQMTFKVECKHLLPVIKQFVNVPMIESEKAWTIKKDLHRNYNDILKIEDCVNQVFLTMESSEQVEKAKVYLFLIFYKLYYYINYYSKSTSEEFYFKDYIPFLSRHSNYIFYTRIIELIGKETFYSLLQSKMIKMLFIHKDKSALRTKSEDVYGTEDFGNPTKSFISYFDFMDVTLSEIDENGPDKSEDWLIYKKIDGLTAQFDLENDLILIENRRFYWELLEVLKNNNIIKKNDLTFRTIPHIVKSIQHSNLTDTIYSKSKRYVKKCKPGQVRNKTFKCVKNKAEFKQLIMI